MNWIRRAIAPLMLGTLAWVVPASLGHAQSLALSATNQSLCFWSDTDNDQSSPIPYDPANLGCVENTGLNDLNVFRVTSTTTGNGTGAVVFDIDAGVAVDANPFSSEYQAGRIIYSYTLSISGTGGAPWDLTIDQQMQGLLATDDDGGGLANASSSAVTSALSLGPALSFGSLASRSSSAFGSTPFSASRAGDLVQGVGDTVLNGSIEITLDAFSEWGGLFGGAIDGAVLFGIDDVSQSGFVTVDEYATWGRAVAPDGYQASFSLVVAGSFCGDGTTDPGEECDDGGISNDDGCSSNCIIEFCGDGIRQSGIGEDCDDGGNVDGDGCSATCTNESLPVPSLSPAGLLGLCAVIGSAGLIAVLGRRRV